MLRGFLLDSARCLENRAYYHRWIDFAAQRGVNTLLWHFTDDQGCSLIFDCLPEAASPHAYSKREMKAFIRYARERGITIVPELATLGHCRYITRLPRYRHLDEADSHFTGMCPVSDETRTIIRQLLQETAEVFDAEHLHVGLDEVKIGDHPLTATALRTRSRGELIADYVGFVHDIVTNHLGRRMWMWGDGLLADTELLDAVPKDVVVCNWQYAPDPPVQTTERLLDAGFDVVLCSALISHDQTLFPGQQFALPNIRNLRRQEELPARPGTAAVAAKVLGSIVTIWTPVRYLADSLWLGMDLAAAMLHDGERYDQDAHLEQFGRTWYGLQSDDSSTRFADACRRVLQLAPLRTEWLAVTQAELQSATVPPRQQVSSEWSRVCDQLRQLRPAVADNLSGFDAFLLMCEVVAHAYAAAVLAAEPAAVAELHAVLRHGQHLLDALDRTWDQERFPGDPRKWVAPLRAFQDDHLLPLFRHGLDAVRHRLATAKVSPTEKPSCVLAG